MKEQKEAKDATEVKEVKDVKEIKEKRDSSHKKRAMEKRASPRRSPRGAKPAMRRLRSE
jgi:hypothetical protein